MFAGRWLEQGGHNAAFLIVVAIDSTNVRSYLFVSFETMRCYVEEEWSGCWCDADRK